MQKCVAEEIPEQKSGKGECKSYPQMGDEERKELVWG